jgi:hypothetical protein
LLVDESVCAAWVERVFEDALDAGIVSLAVNVDMEALVGVGDPYKQAVST